MDEALIGEFKSFREQCIWLRCCYNSYVTLFESGHETLDLLHRSAGIFFHDINIIFIEYILLQICKITDPAVTQGKENLTIEYFNRRLRCKMGHEISCYSEKIHNYRRIIGKARNKRISHLDKISALSGKNLGEHAEDDVYMFFDNLQKYVDAVGCIVGEGPLDFTTTAGPGDAEDLLIKLRQLDCEPRRLG
jgi:hypothetical protein